MKKRLDNLLEAINLANYEIKTAEVSLDDLMFLRSIILDQRKSLIKAGKALIVAESLQKSRHIARLDTYI